jgi:hypothetical protein
MITIILIRKIIVTPMGTFQATIPPLRHRCLHTQRPVPRVLFSSARPFARPGEFLSAEFLRSPDAQTRTNSDADETSGTVSPPSGLPGRMDRRPPETSSPATAAGDLTLSGVFGAWLWLSWQPRAAPFARRGQGEDRIRRWQRRSFLVGEKGTWS